MNKFCTNCGHELKPEEKFCPSCGFNTESVKQAKESVSNTQNVNSYQNTNQYQNANAYQNPNNAAFGNDDITMKNMLAQLSQKNQTNAIIWIVIGALQIIGAIYIITIYLISSILNWKFSLNLQSIFMIIIAIVFGILGGIIGVNRK